MSPTQHTVASGVTSAIFYAVHPSWSATAICFLSGIFIDLDHVLDLYLYKKRLFLGLNDLFNFCGREKGGKLYLILHSYELLVLFWIAIFMFRLDINWLGLGVGLSVHLILDQIFNPMMPLAYFLLYRFKCGFIKKDIVNSVCFSKMDL